MKKIYLISLSVLLVNISLIAQSTSWIGATNNKWKTASNWTNGVPNQNTNAIIGDANFTGSNQPQLNGSTAKCLNLTIGNGAIASSLSIKKNIIVYGDLLIGSNGTINANNNNRTITVKGDWTNNGTYSATSSTARVIFSGSTQTVSGATTFQRVQVNSSSKLTLSSNITINNEIKLYGELHPDPSVAVLGTGDIKVKNYGDLYVYSENFTDNYPISGTITLDKYSYVNYASSSITQYISNAFSYGRLRISGGSTKELTANLPDLQSSNSSTGYIYVDAGTLDLKTFKADRGTSSTGGRVYVSAGTTLKIGGSNGFPANYSYKSVNSTSTIEYYGDNQNVIDLNYGNLIFSGTSGSVVKTMPATPVRIYGDFTASIGTATNLSFTANSNLDFRKDITLGANTTFDGGSYTHTFRGDWTNNGTYTGSTSIAYFRGNNATLTGSGNNNFHDLWIRGVGTTCDGSTPVNVSGHLKTVSGGTFTHGSSGTVTMTGSNKIISGNGFRLYNLTINDTINTTSSIYVSGDFTCDGVFTATNGYMRLNGISKTIAGSGDITFYRLNIYNDITTNRDFSIKSNWYVAPSGSFVASGGNVTFIGYTTLTGNIDLYDLTINTSKTLRLGTNSVLGIANSFTKNGNLNVTSYKPNLVEYNGSGNQTVTAATYHNVTMTNGGTKTSAGNFTVRGDLTINSSTTFDASSSVLTIYNDWVNNGTFTASTSNIQFRSSAISNIYGTTAFNDLTVNKSSSSTYTYLKNSVTANNIIMTKGTMDTESNSVTTYGGRSGSGIIFGTITHNHAFTNGTAYYFEGPRNYIKFTNPSAGLTSVSVKIIPDEVTDFDPNVECIEREYEITIPAGTYTDATLRFHYEDNELSAFEEPFLAIYKHNTGIIWDSIGYTSRHTSQNWVEHTALTAIPGRYTFSGQRRVLEWNGSVSDEWDDPDNWTTISGSDTSSRVPTSLDAAKIGTSTFTNQPTVYNNETVAALRFGSAQAVTLTLDNSITTVNSVKGIWSTTRTHTINVGSSLLDVGSNLHLGNGTAGNIIDINASSGSINVDNDLEHKATSSINFSGAGDLTINGSYNYVSGSFTPATSTVIYSGPISQVVAPFTYYNLSFTKTNERAVINSSTDVNGNLETSIGGEVELKDTLTVAGNITIGNFTTFIESNADIYLAGNWTNNGTFNPGTGEVNFNGTIAQSVNGTTFNDVIVNKSSGTLTLTDSIYVNGDLNITNGTVDLDVYKADRSNNGGTFSLAANTNLKVGGADNFPNLYSTTTVDSLSTVEYDGTIAQNVLDGITYGNLTFSNGGANAKSVLGDITVKNDLLINSGSTVTLDSVNVTLSGNFTNSGTVNPGESTLTLNGNTKTVTGPVSLNNLTVNGDYTVISGTTSMTGNLYIETAASLSFGSNDATLDGDLTNKGSLTSNGTATFTGTRVQTLQLLNAITSSSTGIINFNGTVAPILTSTSSPTFATVNINNTAGITAGSPWFVYFDCNIDAASSFNDGGFTHTFYGNFTNDGDVVSSGNLIFSPGAPFTASGTITLDGNSFTSTGDVTFTGTAPITIVDNNPSFNNVIISNTHSSGVTAPSSWNIANDLLVYNGATFKAGTSTSHTISNSLLNNGTIDGETSTITFDGVGAQVNGVGTTTFNNLTVDAGADLTLNKSININKDFVNDGAFTGIGRTVSFTGTNASVISGAAASITFGELEQNKTSNTTTLSIPVAVNDSLYLNNGIILTDATNVLTINDDANSSSGNATSFVDGPMKKIGDNAFVFPLGDGTRWARLGISAPTATTDAFTAEYFNTNYADTTTMAVAPAPVLNNVSKSEYWTCDRTNGTSNVKVQLFWENDAQSGIDNFTGDLVVAHWNGSAWENAGQSAITASSPGNVTSNTVSSFSPFTFGSLSNGLNPLPVELIHFEVEIVNSVVEVSWITETEINNDYFLVEKSTDGVNFTEIAQIKGAGNSTNKINYKHLDYNPSEGVSYYRLKQVDFNGEYTYSAIRTVSNTSTKTELTVYPNPNKGDLINLSFNKTEKEAEIIITDIYGKAVFYKNIGEEINRYTIQLQEKLPSGIYFVKIMSNEQELIEKLIIN